MRMNRKFSWERNELPREKTKSSREEKIVYWQIKKFIC